MEDIKQDSNEQPNYKEIEFLEVDFNRDENAHLIIKIKGRDYWKQFRRTDESLCTVGGVKCYRPILEVISDVKGHFYIDNLHEVNEMPNLMLLMAKDIEGGVTFDFGIVPMSESRCYQWAENFKYQAKTIYLCYVKPVEFKAIFTTQTVEKEIID